MGGSPPFHYILLAQGLGAGSEAFGQRVSRQCHHGSNLRMLVSMSCYCCLQAFVVLSVLQLAAPGLTDGQGALSMWRLIGQHPGLLVNAVNNSVYWLALSFLLREPLGAVLVVLAFLFASFLVDPFQAIVGLPVTAHLTAGALVPGILGGAAVVLEMPVDRADRALAAVTRLLAAAGVPVFGCCRRQPAAPAAAASTTASATVSGAAGCSDGLKASDSVRAFAADRSDSAAASPVDAAASDDELSQLIAPAPTIAAPVARFSTEPLESSSSSSGGVDGGEDAASRSVDVHGGTTNASGVPRALTASSVVDAPAAAGSAGLAVWSLAACNSALRRSPAVLIAFCALAVTTGIGIVVATYFEQVAKLNSFGYTAIDQVLLPFTTLPLVMLIESSRRLRWLVGEPAWSPAHSKAPRPWLVIQRAWGEVCGQPWVDAPAASSTGGDTLAGITSGLRSHAVDLPSTSPRASARHHRGGLLAAVFGAVCRRSFLPTLVAFHGLEFIRTFIFFWLVTQFDVDSTYFTMTVTRIALCWFVSLLACSLMRSWVGITEAEARRALHPVILAQKLCGSALLMVSIMSLKGLL